MCVTGMIAMWGGTEENLPAGWLPCDGRSLSRNAYANLYSAIGTNFGMNPPPGEFYIPDLRGRFVRGQDPTGLRDPDAAARQDMQSGTQVGAAVGSVQSDALQSHVHDYQVYPSSDVNGIAGGSYWAAGSAQTSNAMSARTSSETRPVNAYVIYMIMT
jgi:microcystin-dependent protein